MVTLEDEMEYRPADITDTSLGRLLTSHCAETLGYMFGGQPTLICGQSVGRGEVCQKAATVQNADTSSTCPEHRR